MQSSPLGVRYVPLYWIGLLGLFLGGVYSKRVAMEDSR
jgi:hypothetical protein